MFRVFAIAVPLNGTQGDEIGMTDNKEFPVQDPRDVCRTPMQWDNSIAAGKNKWNLCGLDATAIRLIAVIVIIIIAAQAHNTHTHM